MASVTKRPNGQWRARYRDSAGNEHARHFARKVDAQAWLDGVTTAVQTGSYVDPARSRLTVGSLAAQWIEGKVSLKLMTRALYDSVLGMHVLPRWQNIPLTRVEHGDVQAWVAQLVASGQSAGHVRRSTARSPASFRSLSATDACRQTQPSASTSPECANAGAGT